MRRRVPGDPVLGSLPRTVNYTSPLLEVGLAPGPGASTGTLLQPARSFAATSRGFKELGREGPTSWSPGRLPPK